MVSTGPELEMPQRKFTTMKRVFVTAGLVLVLQGLGLVRAATLFTVPVIVVTPAALDFGVVASQTSATNSFVLENAGGGTLVGKVTVPPPFKVVSGETYSLKNREIQVVMIAYSPTGASNDMQMVKFTGANPVTAKVMGRQGQPSPKVSKRK
jgi:hypothetical protein